MALIAFGLIAAVVILSALFVIAARNPVHSVLWLILAFFSSAGLMVLIGAEFLAMLLIVVYVGAVAVLFLFVVMMLDIDFARLREGFQRYAPVGALIGLVLLVQLVMVMISWRMAPGAMALRLNETPSDIPNAQALGRILYTDYIYLFQGCGLILLVAMIGAIVLTLRDKPNSKRQNIAEQIARAGSVTNVAVPTGAGLKQLGIRRPPAPEEAAPKPIEHHHGHGGHH